MKFLSIFIILLITSAGLAVSTYTSDNLVANDTVTGGTLTDGTLSINSGSITSAINGSFSGAITGTSFIIGANTLTTTEWAFLDGLDQALKTTDAPSFATGVTIGNLTLANGSIVDSSNAIDFGATIPTASHMYLNYGFYHQGDADTSFQMITDGYTFMAGNTQMIVVIGATSPKQVVINQQQQDVDFRIEGDTDTNLFFTDGSTDRVGIGTATPAQKLDVNGVTLVRDKIAFTQTDGNEYIDSDANGYMDYGATTAHRFNNDVNVTGAVFVSGTLDVIGNIDPTSYETTRGGFKNEDDMASSSDTAVVSQDSLVKYVYSKTSTGVWQIPLEESHLGGAGLSTAIGDLTGWLVGFAWDNYYITFPVPKDWDGASDLIVKMFLVLTAEETAGDDIPIDAYMIAVGDHENEDGQPQQTFDIDHDIGNYTSYGTIHQVSITLDYNDVTAPIAAGDVISINLSTPVPESEGYTDDVALVTAELAYTKP